MTPTSTPHGCEQTKTGETIEEEVDLAELEGLVTDATTSMPEFLTEGRAPAFMRVRIKVDVKGVDSFSGGVTLTLIHSQKAAVDVDAGTSDSAVRIAIPPLHKQLSVVRLH
jgi:hypothetical protein